MSKKKRLAAAAAAAGVEETLYAPNCAVKSAEFDYVGPDPERMEGISRPSVSFWKDAMRRLWSNKTAVVCTVVLAIILICALIFPILSPFDMSAQHLEHTNKGLFYTATLADGSTHMHIFGTDDLGRDVFVRIWEGARISLLIAFTAVFINFVIGIVYGGISGYFGGWIDNVLMRILEIINGIPYLIIVILLMMILPRGIVSIIVAYGLVGWTGMARLVRGQILALKEQEFVVAAEAMGAAPTRIIAKHLLPNILSVVIINITLAIPSAIFSEAFLSFIGMGVPVPNASWGTLANDGVRLFQIHPHLLALPAFFISITMLAFNLLGDALRDAFDPKLRR